MNRIDGRHGHKSICDFDKETRKQILKKTVLAMSEAGQITQLHEEECKYPCILSWKKNKFQKIKDFSRRPDIKCTQEESKKLILFHWQWKDLSEHYLKSIDMKVDI